MPIESLLFHISRYRKAMRIHYEALPELFMCERTTSSLTGHGIACICLMNWTDLISSVRVGAIASLQAAHARAKWRLTINLQFCCLLRFSWWTRQMTGIWKFHLSSKWCTNVMPFGSGFAPWQLHHLYSTIYQGAFLASASCQCQPKRCFPIWSLGLVTSRLSSHSHAMLCLSQ